MKGLKYALVVLAVSLVVLTLGSCMELLYEMENQGTIQDTPAQDGDEQDVAGDSSSQNGDAQDVGEEAPAQEEEDPEYLVGDRGPAGGRVFYDKGYYEDGWRYLEAAPVNWAGTWPDPKAQWGAYRVDEEEVLAGVEPDIGMVNTPAIIAYHNNLAEQFPDKGSYYTNADQYYVTSDGTVAAKLCAEADIFGYDDWFLPSREELELMHVRLYKNGIGHFNADLYWSSSEKDSRSAYKMNFYVGGSASGTYKNTSYYVRPVRAF